jgi:hypothetical protein
VAVAGDGQVHHRLRVGLLLLHDRLVDFLGQEAARLRHAVAHVRGRAVGIAIEMEAHRDLRVLGAADRLDVVDALDAGQRFLDGRGDLRLHDLGVGAGIRGVHRHQELVPVVG